MSEEQEISFQEWAIVEEWRPVVGFEGVYEVNAIGHVRRVAGGRGIQVGHILGWLAGPEGYPRVQLWKENRPTTRLLHRIVAEAFLGPVPDGHEVNHKDGDKANPFASNLEYVTRSQNNLHAYDTGLRARGEEHSAAKLTRDQVLAIKKAHRDGVAGCRKLARQYGVSKSTVINIFRGVAWKGVEERS